MMEREEDGLLRSGAVEMPPGEVEAQLRVMRGGKARPPRQQDAIVDCCHGAPVR
jgi:hypothetical protein